MPGPSGWTFACLLQRTGSFLARTVRVSAGWGGPFWLIFLARLLLPGRRGPCGWPGPWLKDRRGYGSWFPGSLSVAGSLPTPLLRPLALQGCSRIWLLWGRLSGGALGYPEEPGLAVRGGLKSRKATKNWPRQPTEAPWDRCLWLSVPTVALGLAVDADCGYSLAVRADCGPGIGSWWPLLLLGWRVRLEGSETTVGSRDRPETAP